MAKLKKGSEAAKAWGRKMRELRNSKSKRNINKPVSVMHSRKKVIRISRKNRGHKEHRGGKRAFHVVPDLMEVGGIAYPFIDSSTTGYSALGSLGNAVMGTGGVSRSQAISDAFDNLKGNFSNSLLPAGELIIGGLVVKWLGKKTGLNKVGTKEVKIL